MTNTADTTGYDRASYTRGWRASAGNGSLDAADRRGEPNEWYDGYSDYAQGFDKWHRRNCASENHDVRGCLPPEQHAQRIAEDVRHAEEYAAGWRELRAAEGEVWTVLQDGEPLRDPNGLVLCYVDADNADRRRHAESLRYPLHSFVTHRRRRPAWSLSMD